MRPMASYTPRRPEPRRFLGTQAREASFASRAKTRAAVATIVLLDLADTLAGSGGRAGRQAGWPPEMSAADFYKDSISLKAADVMNRDGVVVSGPALRTLKEQDGSVKVWLDATGGKWVSFSFEGKGAVVTAKAVKKGDPVAAKCDVGGASGNYGMNIGCELSDAAGSSTRLKGDPQERRGRGPRAGAAPLATTSPAQTTDGATPALAQQAAVSGHWLTWSARARIDDGRVTPSAFAVLRFTASSKIVGCSTGSSAGLAPLRIRSTWAATRRGSSRWLLPYDIRPPSSTCSRHW